jgi:hypothetical protein
MRNLLYIVALSVSLWSCGGGGGETPTPTPVNTAPTVPTLTAPVNNSLCIDNVLNFQWSTSTDAEGETITYEIQVAKDNLFAQIAHTQTSTTPSKSITLEKGFAYYWRVKATDNKNAASNYSATFSLYTEGVGVSNHLPFSPELVSPVLNEIVHGAPKTTALTWTASDVDTTDSLTYDVYFDTVNPPTAKVSASQTAKTYSAALVASTKYYWKVVVKDNKGGQTIGQIWSFTTD